MGRSKDAQRTDQPFHGRIGARVIAERQYGVRSCTRPLYVDFVAGVVGDGPSFAARSEESALRYGQWQERQCQGHIKRKKLHDSQEIWAPAPGPLFEPCSFRISPAVLSLRLVGMAPKGSPPTSQAGSGTGMIPPELSPEIYNVVKPKTAANHYP
ncbi:hypothetical protein PG990_000847 [Apiospora arundinis]